MAILQKRWIVSILLTNIGFAASDPPAPPSDPGCVRECDKSRCKDNIYCSWKTGPDPQIPTRYNLHWKYGPDPHRTLTSLGQPRNSGQGNVTSVNGLSALIPRKHFLNDGDLHVWVEVNNEQGTARSQESVFNTAEIKKPPPPDISVRQHEPLEIEWQSGICGDLGLSMGTCEVQHKIEGNGVWLEHESGFLHTYTLESPLPSTAYEFQVRCNCSTSLISEWSPSLRAKSAESAPVGELDIWRDCGISSANFDCALTWKTLPISQARGVILGYDVILFYRNLTRTRLNVSTAEPGRPLWCNETRCHLASSLKDVSSVSVSAFNSRGTTTPSNLSMPTPGTGEDGMTIHLKMNEENLTVWWDPPSQPRHTLKEYVVQYKQVGTPPGQVFDWVKVAGNQTSVFFKGQFKKYTAFQVSLFAISDFSTVHYLSSALEYSHEGISSRVPMFTASAIADTQVTLFWKTVPLSEQKGVIQYYQIGLDSLRVYNVIAAPRSENGTFNLTHLSSGQKYQVWIRAVTKAGPGANTSTTFTTTEQRHNGDQLKFLLPPLCLIGICPLLLCIFCGARNKFCPKGSSLFSAKVPDPRNSRICREMKNLINDPFALSHMPFNEPHPHISVLEIVTVQPDASKSTLRATTEPGESTGPVVKVGCSQRESQDEQSEDSLSEKCGRPGHGIGRQEYSKMVDSDEEKDKEEDCWSSTEEEQLTSGYEQHFMPSALEILEV